MLTATRSRGPRNVSAGRPHCVSVAGVLVDDRSRALLGRRQTHLEGRRAGTRTGARGQPHLPHPSSRRGQTRLHTAYRSTAGGTGGGALDAGPAALIVTRMIPIWADSRTTTAVHLRNRNFRVVHSPTRGNRLHVSVFPPDLAEGEPAEWDDAMAEQFNQCFAEEDAEGGGLGG